MITAPPTGTRGGRRLLLAALLALFAPTLTPAQITLPLGPDGTTRFTTEAPPTWLDRTHRGLHRLMWRSARGIDSWMGTPFEDTVYQEASGSIGVAVLYDEFDGFDAKVRFQVNLPLPRINKRLRLFIGRVNPDEFVTEEVQSDGTIPPLQREVNEEDQTLAGFVYDRPGRDGSSFSASAGTSFRSSALDPYVKASYRYRRNLWNDTRLTVKETLFYRTSEKFGLTTRIDLERMLEEPWQLRWTGTATISEESEGVRGSTTLTATRTLRGRRALILRLGAQGETDADVPLQDFGLQVAYRTAVIRDWLVLELRSSVSWPKELPTQARKPSFGVGIGLEMYFGREEFSSHPMMF